MERSRLARLGARRFIPWTIAAITLIVGAGALVYGSVPHTFNTGDTLQAADLNGNFTAFEQRLTALESAKSTVTAVMDNVAGPLTTPKTAPFTSAGGPVTLVVSGSAYATAAQSILDLAVTLDGQPVGDLKVFTGEANTHRALPTRAFAVPTLAAGSHTVGISIGPDTVTGGHDATDGNDLYSVTAIELAH